jgi:aminoglycoside phosphotransferase (APT) family kinase protein
MHARKRGASTAWQHPPVGLREPLAAGRDADVFSLDDHRVLRRYRDGSDATAEAALMSYLSSCAYPVPTVYDAQGADLVMERIDGPTMLQALVARDLTAQAAGEVLAGLHTRLHCLPARVSPDPATRVLHMDLHPDNVMIGSNGPVVIDWRNATEGSPDLDVAMTSVIVAQAAVGRGPRAASARTLVAAFLHDTDGDPARMLDTALAIRGRDRNLTSHEIDQLTVAGAIVLELI